MFSKPLNWMRRHVKTARIAAVLSFVVLIVAFGVVQASGPMRPQPPMKPGGMGMWGHVRRVWYPMEPVPTIKITAVVKDESVTFETENFPEDEDFTVTMGKMYTRGINGIEVGTFNSGEGGSFEQTFKIPEDLQGQYRIAIRAQTDHTFPYYSFNWFYNNSTEVEEAEEEEAEVEETAEAPAEETAEAPAEETAEAPAEETAEAPAEETAEAPAEETAEAPAEEAASELTGQAWQWVALSDPVQGDQEIENPENYTIEFLPEGGVRVQADCNSGTGSFTDEAGTLTVSVPAMTLAICPEGSLGDEFVNYIHASSTYSIEDGTLVIDMAPDGGTLTFQAQGAAAEEVGTGGAADTEEAAETTEGEAATTEETTEGEAATTEETTEGEAATTEETTEGEAATTEETTEGEAATTEGEAEVTEGEEAVTEEAEGEAPEGEGPGLVGGIWQWSEFTNPVDGTVTVEDPTLYTAEFLADGTVQVQADCNSGRGSYTVDGSSITISPLAMTRALCEEGSLSDDFVMYLEMAAIFFFDEGNLYIDLPADGGTMMFVPANGEETSSFIRGASMKAAIQNGDEEVDEDAVPSFEICTVVKNETVAVLTADFPADQVFNVTMGPILVAKPMMKPGYGPMPMPMPMPEQMPEYPPMGQGPMMEPMGQGPMMEPMGQGPMMEPMGMGPGMDSMYMGPPKGGMDMGMGYGDMWGKPMPPKVYVPFYYEAGTFESGDGGTMEAKFEIPDELAGYYRIQVMLRTEHQYPYFAYNWFYNNDAAVCEGNNND